MWDRWGGTFEAMIVFGWIDRSDARSDFLVLHISSGVVFGFTTSSAKYSDDFAKRVGLAAEHSECKRVEHDFPVQNCIRLSPVAQLPTTPLPEAA